MRSNYLVLVSKIIFFYSIFYVVMKVIAAAGGNWPEANLILAIPYLIFAGVGGYIVKNGKYHWAYVVAGIIIITAVRYFEQEWMIAITNYFEG